MEIPSQRCGQRNHPGLTSMWGPELASYRDDDANGIGLHDGGERAIAGANQIAFGDRGIVDAVDDRRRNLGLAEIDLRRLDLRSAALTLAASAFSVTTGVSTDGLLSDFGSIAAFVLSCGQTGSLPGTINCSLLHIHAEQSTHCDVCAWNF
jgi:hypothetical protein